MLYASLVAYMSGQRGGNREPWDTSDTSFAGQDHILAADVISSA